MPRPIKLRNVCSLPNNCRFGPLDNRAEPSGCITMTVDEYETIRLIDLEGCTQEECSVQMNVARTTVQGIYNEARRKLAESLVNGKILHIGGGEFRLCDGIIGGCGRGCHRLDCIKNIERKENRTMKIAIPADTNAENSEVCVSFGRTPYFAIYDSVTKRIEFFENPAAENSGGAGISAAQFLVDKNVTAVITQRLGINVAEVFKAADIQIFKSIEGDIATNLQKYLDGAAEPLTHFHAGFHGIKA